MSFVSPGTPKQDPLPAGSEFNLLNDRPLGDADTADLLGTRETAARLADLLLASRDQAPFTLAVYADWGMGKSSLMAEIRQLLKESTEVHTTWFNAWTAQHADALEGLIKSVLGQLDRSVLRRMLRALRGERTTAVLRTLVLAAFGLLRLDRAVDEVWNRMSLDARARNAGREVVREALRSWVDAGAMTSPSRMLVVFVDDLDRCPDTVIVTVCEAIKLYLDIPGVVFVIGCDPRVLVHAADSGAARGRAYLEKIVQVGHHIPPPDDQNVTALVAGYAAAAGASTLFRDAVTEVITERGERNPRQIKRLINHFVLEYRLDHDWRRLGADTLVRVLLLQEFYLDFYRLLAQPAEPDPIDEILDYVTLKDALWTAPSAAEKRHTLDEPHRAALDRALAMHRLPPLGDAQPDTDELRSYVTLVEADLPREYATLIADRGFLNLVRGLRGNVDPEGVLRAKLRRKVRAGYDRPRVAVPDAENAPAERGAGRYGDAAGTAAASQPSHLSGLRVLQFDDDAERSQTTDLLRRLGAEVTYTSSAEEARRVLLGSPRPHVLLSDITRFDDPNRGFDDYERLRANVDFDLPVVFYTGRLTPLREQRAAQLGALAITVSPLAMLDALAGVARSARADSDNQYDDGSYKGQDDHTGGRDLLGLAGLHLLWCEDVPQDDSRVRCLTDRRVFVHVARDRAEAEAVLRSDPYDGLVVRDLDTLARLHETRAPRLPTIIFDEGADPPRQGGAEGMDLPDIVGVARDERELVELVARLGRGPRHYRAPAGTGSGRDAEARQLMAMGRSLLAAGDLDRAEQRFSTASVYYSEAHDDRGRGDAALARGELALRRGRTELAIDSFRRAGVLYRSAGDEPGLERARQALTAALGGADPGALPAQNRAIATWLQRPHAESTQFAAGTATTRNDDA